MDMIGIGEIVSVEVVVKAINRSMNNESDYKEDRIRVYSAFDSCLLHYDGSTRQFSWY